MRIANQWLLTRRRTPPGAPVSYGTPPEGLQILTSTFTHSWPRDSQRPIGLGIPNIQTERNPKSLAPPPSIMANLVNNRVAQFASKICARAHAPCASSCHVYLLSVKTHRSASGFALLFLIHHLPRQNHNEAPPPPPGQNRLLIVAEPQVEPSSAAARAFNPARLMS